MAVIEDVAGMWVKLAWDVDVFRDIQIYYPHEQQPLAYAAINACIAAISLRNWAETAVRSKARAFGGAFDKQGFDRDVRKAVPAQAMCEAIANTAKHSRFADGEWPGGRVSLGREKGDEDSSPGWILRYGVEEAAVPGLSVNWFGSLPETWWGTCAIFSWSKATTNSRTGSRTNSAGYSVAGGRLKAFWRRSDILPFQGRHAHAGRVERTIDPLDDVLRHGAQPLGPVIRATAVVFKRVGEQEVIGPRMDREPFGERQVHLQRRSGEEGPLHMAISIKEWVDEAELAEQIGQSPVGPKAGRGYRYDREL